MFDVYTKEINRTLEKVKAKREKEDIIKRNRQKRILKNSLKLKGANIKNKAYCVYDRLVDILTQHSAYVEGSLTSSQNEKVLFKKENHLVIIKHNKKEFSFDF